MSVLLPAAPPPPSPPAFYGSVETPYGRATLWTLSHPATRGFTCVCLDGIRDRERGRDAFFALLSCNGPSQDALLGPGEFCADVRGWFAEALPALLASGVFEDTGRTLATLGGDSPVWRVLRREEAACVS